MAGRLLGYKLIFYYWLLSTAGEKAETIINIKFHLTSRGLSGQKKTLRWGKIIAILPPTIQGPADARNSSKTHTTFPFTREMYLTTETFLWFDFVIFFTLRPLIDQNCCRLFKKSLLLWFLKKPIFLNIIIFFTLRSLRGRISF